MDATLWNETVRAGESARVSVTVRNAGNRTDRFAVALTVEDSEVATEQIRLDGGESRTVVFDPVFATRGIYDLAVNGTAVGTVAVEPPAVATTAVTASPGRASSVEVLAVGSLPDWVQRGLNVTLRATVVNRGDEPARRVLTVAVDDERVASETVTLAPNERSSVTFDFEAVDGRVTVGNTTAGRLEVGERPTPAGPTDSASGPAPSPALVALVVVATALWLAVARRDD